MKTVQTDVCVIAGGPSGLAAAVSAAEKGANVVILEKTMTTGGAGNMGMGPFAVESHIQKEAMNELTLDQAFRIFMDYTHWRVDARLVHDYLEKSASTIEWLEDMGVQFYDAVKYFPTGNATWHRVKPENGKPGPRGASVMYKRMTERALELGVQILYETPAQHIEMTNGEVTAVLAQDKSGEDVRVECIAAVIATGGFGNNPEMIQELIGYEHGKNLFSFRIPGIMGDGIRMAWEVGAARTNMTIEMTTECPGVNDAGLPGMLFFQPKALVLNKNCERFINEELLENTTFSANAIDLQPDKYGISILDSSVLDWYAKRGLDVISNVHDSNGKPVTFEQDARKAVEQGAENIYVADSLAELAQQLGLESGKLEQAVDVYNQGCSTKEDLFYKQAKHLKPLTGPHYFATKMKLSGYGTLGGIKINHKTQVLSTEGTPISGLYAAGTDACSIFGDSYVFVLPGNTMGFAVNSGRIAGENAAGYVFMEDEE